MAERRNGVMEKDIGCTCPNGKKYPNDVAMCKAYGISRQKYRYRIIAGWTQRQALGLDEPPEGTVGTSKPSYCPNGKKYPSIGAMCKAHGVGTANYYSRMKAGWTQQQALGIDAPPKNVNGIPIPSCCPKGKVFPTLKAMCDTYKVNSTTYLSRLKSNWTQRQALGLDSPPNSVCCPKGKEFPSLRAMCEAYGVPHVTYNSRLRSGWTQRQALGIDPAPGGSRWPKCRGVSAKSIANAHKKPLKLLYRYQAVSWINYVENILLWSNENFLGFTEDGLVVLRQDGEIATLEFSKYIDALQCK